LKGLFSAALEIQEFLGHAGDRFCFIGGVALQRWGQPRLTQDVDLTSEFDFGTGFRLFTCSAEDLIVMKAFASRPRDWIDIEAVVIRRRRTLDWKQVFDELEPLVALRETPERVLRLFAR
jgi:hypothetical protein